MSPQEIATMSSVIQGLSGMPIGTLVIVALVLPWISVLIFTWLMRGMIEKFREQFQRETTEARERFEAVVKMYENNSALVKNYEKLASDQQDLIISNTTTMQRLCDRMER